MIVGERFIVMRILNVGKKSVVKEDRIYDYLLCFILFLNIESIYFKRNDLASAVFEVVLCGVLCLYLFFSRSVGNLTNKYCASIASLGGLYLIVLILVYIHGGANSVLGNMLQKIIIFCVLMPLFMLMIKKKGFIYIKEIFLIRYVNVYSFFAFLGFICWLLDALGVSIPSISVPFSWGGNRVGNGLLGLTFNITLSDQAFSQGWYRFTFLLVEGPIAISYFALIAIIEISCNSRPRLHIVLFMSLCMFCTFTGFGMLLTAPIIVLGLINSIGFKKTIKKSPITYFAYYLVMLFMLIGAPLVSLKLFSEKENTGSTSLHIADFVGGYRAFQNSPLLGYGVGNYGPLHQYSDDGLAGTSSALMMGVVQGGIVFVSIIVIPVILAFTMMAVRNQFRMSLLPLFTLVFYVNGLSDNSPIFALLMSMCWYYILFERERRIQEA